MFSREIFLLGEVIRSFLLVREVTLYTLHATQIIRATRIVCNLPQQSTHNRRSIVAFLVRVATKVAENLHVGGNDVP